jgi:hypothetical protein
MTTNEKPPIYLPTPAEIEAACLAFQSGWSDAERQSRRVGPRTLFRHDTAEVERFARWKLDEKLAKVRDGRSHQH